MVLGFDEQKPYRMKSTYVHYLKDWVKLKSTITGKQYLTKAYRSGFYEPRNEEPTKVSWLLVWYDF